MYDLGQSAGDTTQPCTGSSSDDIIQTWVESVDLSMSRVEVLLLLLLHGLLLFSEIFQKPPSRT